MVRRATLQMRSPLVRPVLAYVRAKGGDPERLTRAFDLPPSAERDAEAVLPLEALHGFLDAAAAEIADPFLGLHVASHFERGTYGLLEYAWRSAPTVGEALKRVVRYISLFNDFVVVALHRRRGAAVIEQRIPGFSLCVGRHGNEFFAAAILLQARELTGARVVPERVWFGHAAPPDAGELFRVLGTDRVDFGAEGNGIELSPATLALPISSADPALLQLIDRFADKELALRASPTRFLGQVRQGIRANLGDGPPSLASAARGLRVSPRTLQRRIADEGTSFHALVESVREELARVHVAEAARPLGEIAFLLGYSELRPFLRAFRRWTGVTPTQYRVGQTPAAAAPTARGP
jgi:AraC-like DNA-binding protein